MVGRRTGIAGIFAAASLALAIIAAPASAETYEVSPDPPLAFPNDNICQFYEAAQAATTDTADPMDCAAGTNGATDVIQLDGGTYVLTNQVAIFNQDPGEAVSFVRGDLSPVTLQQTSDGDPVFDVSTGGLLIDEMTITGGEQNGASYGGGIKLTGATTSLTMTDSTVSGNSSIDQVGDGGDGGGIGANGGADITLSDVTISGNVAESRGGGITHDGDLTLNDVTITGNTADFGASSPLGARGGGVVRSGAGALTVNNSIIAGNVDENPVGNNAPDCSGFDFPPAAVAAFTTVGDNTGCGFTAAGSNLVGAPGISPTLAANGGPTMTHRLLPSSLAADSGSGCGPTDQRGFPSPAGHECDRGAYEDQPPELAPVDDKTVQAGQTLSFAISATDADPFDTIVYSSPNLPTGASIDPATGAFTWTPTAAQAGTYPDIQFRASDFITSLSTDTATITVTLGPAGAVPNPPTTSPPAKKRCKKGRKLVKVKGKRKCVKKKRRR